MLQLTAATGIQPQTLPPTGLLAPSLGNSQHTTKRHEAQRHGCNRPAGPARAHGTQAAGRAFLRLPPAAPLDLAADSPLSSPDASSVKDGAN